MDIFNRFISNKRNILILFIILILLFVITISLINRNNNKVSEKQNTSETLEESKRSLTLSSTSMYVYGFSDNTSEKTDIANIGINVNANIYSFVDIKEAKITNVRLDPKPQTEEYKILFPSSQLFSESANYYYESMGTDRRIKDVKFSDKNSYSFNVVDTIELDKLKKNEIMKSSAMMEFKVFLPNVATYDYEMIMDRDKVFSSNKLLEYSEINGSKLNTTLKYTIEITTIDNVKHIQNISFDIDGNKLVESGSYTNDVNEFSNIKF